MYNTVLYKKQFHVVNYLSFSNFVRQLKIINSIRHRHLVTKVSGIFDRAPVTIVHLKKNDNLDGADFIVQSPALGSQKISLKFRFVDFQ